ncbi:MAG TPA: tetratricopeptide repeat protein, partial [Steroidobacteraceae bacterium]|nr:tetratricopeptide repeat protein [Steroidobacteraceae bacterium]
MLLRRLGWIPLLLALVLPAAHAAGRCTIRTFTIPVTMDGMKPLISARINGVEARFVVDTGAFFQMMSPAAAAQYKLGLEPAPFGLWVGGIGGAVRPDIATVKSFTLGGVSFHGVEFLVGGNDRLPGVAGSLGENLFRVRDLELDLANGVLRMVEPSHCGRQELAYWARTEPIAVVGLRWTTEAHPHLVGEAQLNGHAIHVVFDTGAARSVLSWRAAKRAGITPGSRGVLRLGMISGIGRKPVAAWSAPVDVFEIGGEKIEHTRVTVADIDLEGLHADMLVGADFFLAHHVYIANSQGKLYFTYNGGPVFDLSVPEPARSAPAPAASNATAAATQAPAPTSPTSSAPSLARPVDAASSPAPALSAESDSSEAPVDAAGFLRRGTAYASRREFALALADLTRACDLAPKDAECRYQRGLVYWHDGQPASALADLDAAIALDPRDSQARLARAQLELRQRHAGVEDDLDAVDRIAPPEDNLRLRLGQLYDDIGQYAGAIHQFDLWIDYHREDVSLPTALTDRCGSEAVANIDVDRALDDCNRALRIIPKAAPISASAVTLSNRGLVQVRQKKLDEALADFTAA